MVDEMNRRQRRQAARRHGKGREERRRIAAMLRAADSGIESAPADAPVVRGSDGIARTPSGLLVVEGRDLVR
jgi:hypothetical protein